VKLTAGGETQWRQVMPTKSYLSSSEPEVTFGIGPVSKVDSLEITWPGGNKQLVTNPELGRRTVVRESR
jgi:hypothetical protein